MTKNRDSVQAQMMLDLAEAWAALERVQKAADPAVLLASNERREWRRSVAIVKATVCLLWERLDFIAREEHPEGPRLKRPAVSMRCVGNFRKLLSDGVAPIAWSRLEEFKPGERKLSQTPNAIANRKWRARKKARGDTGRPSIAEQAAEMVKRAGVDLEAMQAAERPLQDGRRSRSAKGRQ